MREIEDLLQKVTSRMLGEEKEDRVRLSWPEDGQPGFSIDEDICFLRVTEADDPYNRQRDVSYQDLPAGQAGALRRTDHYIRVLSVLYIFYGPNAYHRATEVRYKALLPEFKYELAHYGGLYPIPDLPAPMRMPELFAGKWWERCDLTIRFNQALTFETRVAAIESADIIIKKEDGKEIVIYDTVT
jgi:hypothetical protein